MIYAGIDAGSRAIKVVIVNESGVLISKGLENQGVKQISLALQLLERTLQKVDLGPEDLDYSVSTGYGRDLLDFTNKSITEISCHAMGVRHLLPETRTIIDIGGQDSKLIRLDEKGRVYDFVMNDRCAAGTGRFIEVMADRLEIDLDQLGEFIVHADLPSHISSMCVVFAETEIVGLLASGEKPENIAAGVQHSIAARIGSMAGRRIKSPVVLTGGVALIPGMDTVLGDVLKIPVMISPQSQMTGALGAALFAFQSHSEAV